MKSNMTPINPESLEFLSQITRSISTLSGKSDLERQHAEQLYQQALAMMLAVAPSPFQKEWNKIQMARIRIGHEHIISMSSQEPSTETGDGLTPEEEQMYQQAIDM